MVNEFEERLEAAEKPGESESRTKISYSRAYEQFRSEKKTVLSTSYERMANAAGKILKLTLKPEEKEQLQKYITLTHIKVKPESVNALAILSIIPFIAATIVVFILTSSMFFTAILAGAGIFSLYYFANMPKYLFNSWRAQAADQLMLSVLYIVIHMKRDANLERAILFVANQMSPPLSLDFMKVLWDFETKKFSSVQKSLDSYLETWKDSEPAFVDAMHLIEASLVEPNADKAKKTLEKANDVITQGIKDNMIHFAHNLKNPIQMIHMLGIVLPMMMLVMLPMVGAFLADSIKPAQLIIIYNVVLPIFVFIQARNIISVRPGGASVQNKTLLKKFPNSGVGPFFGAAAIIALIALPAIFLIFTIAQSGDWTHLKFENGPFYLTVAIVFSIGIASYVYYHFKNKNVVELKNKIESIEDQFSSAIFQLGNRIGENIPAEAAFGKVAENTKGSEISKFFEIVDSNIRERGMTLEEALFDKKYGATNLYPSELISSIMNLLLEAVKKSPQVAAESMTALSKYLQNMHTIKEKMTDLLSDTLSSMRMQAAFLAPLVSALVVSLSVLITKVLTNLSGQLATIEGGASETGQMGLGGNLGGLFNVESALPPYVLQLMVGIYIIQVVFLLSFTISGIVNGPGKINFEWMLSQNVLKSTLIYCGLTLIGTMIFSSMATLVTASLA